jgi:hypothetical protein
MIERKLRFFEDREQFYFDLETEINRFRKQAKKRGITPAVRLNVGSDIDFRRFAHDRLKIESSDDLPSVAYYDYSKVFNRVLSQLFKPFDERGLRCTENYHLTYSYNERSKTDQVSYLLDHGLNVAIVFDTEYNPRAKRIGSLPAEIKIGREFYHVIDGDKSDVRRRETDGAGRVIGLRFKGSKARRAAAIDSGFCVRAGESIQ